jgi:hypothetical protein
VIFVDADQIVRADMGELYDMNLKGRPLAYTPFCDNNKDMDGFRFWKQVSHWFIINHVTTQTIVYDNNIKVDFFSQVFRWHFLLSSEGFLERSSARKTVPYQVGDIFCQLYCD